MIDSGWFRAELERVRADLRCVVDQAIAFLLPIDCVGCGTPGSSICQMCTTNFDRTPNRSIVGSVPVWSAVDYEGAVRAILYAFKNEHRVDVARPLAHALGASIAAAVAAVPAGVHDLELAIIPSTRAGMRRRGYRPVEILLRKAGYRASRVLVFDRQPRDQIGLGRIARHENLAGTMIANVPLTGRSFVLVDDVITTGATLIEASRAITAGGGSVIAAATVAKTALLSKTTHIPTRSSPAAPGT